MSDWLEMELTDHLAPVAAPDNLWQRIAVGQALPPANRAAVAAPDDLWRVAAGPPRRTRPRPFAAPIAALATLILAGAIWFIARGQQPSAAFRPPAQARAEPCLLCHTTL